MSDTGKIASRSWPRGVVVGVVAFALGFGVGAGLRTLGRVRALADGSATAFAEWEAAEEAKAAARASLEEVLAAPEDAVLAVAARYLRGATRDEIAALAEAWEFKAERVPAVVWTLLLTCWAEQDGPGALAAARRIDGEETALEVFTLRIWAEVEPAAAVAEAEKEPKRLLPSIIDVVARAEMEVALGVIERFPHQEDLTVPVLRILAESDPVEAVARAESIPDARLRRTALLAVVEVWAMGDPAAALAWLEGREVDAGQTRGLTQSILEGIIESHPELATRRITGLGEGALKYHLTKQLAERKAKEDPAAALAWAKSLPEGDEKHAALSIGLRALAKGDPAKLLALLDEYGWDLARVNPGDGKREFGLTGGGGSFGYGGSLDGEVRAAIAGLVREDPEGALGYAAKLSGCGDDLVESARSRTMRDVMRVWFASEPVAAMDWLAKCPPEAGLRAIAQGMANEMTEEQIRWVLDNAGAVPSTEFVEAVIGRHYVSDRFDPDDLLALAESLTGDARDLAIARIAPRLLREDSERAFALLGRLPQGEARQLAVATFLRARPLERALGYFEALPKMDRTPGAYESLASGWLFADREAASRWVAELPSGENRDSAVRSIVRNLYYDASPDFSLALQWAETIDGGEARTQMQQELFNRWLVEDERAANAAIAVSTLPEGARRNLRRWNE